LRLMKGQTMGLKVDLRRDKAYDFLNMWRHEVLPTMTAEYKGAGMDTLGTVGSGMSGPPQILRELHPDFENFKGFAWTATVTKAKRGVLHRIHQDVASLVFSGMGIPVRGHGAYDAQSLQEEADREKEQRDMALAKGGEGPPPPP